MQRDYKRKKINRYRNDNHNNNKKIVDKMIFDEDQHQNRNTKAKTNWRMEIKGIRNYLIKKKKDNSKQMNLNDHNIKEWN